MPKMAGDPLRSPRGRGFVDKLLAKPVKVALKLPPTWSEANLGIFVFKVR